MALGNAELGIRNSELEVARRGGEGVSLTLVLAVGEGREGLGNV